jgi:hypothetical protein
MNSSAVGGHEFEEMCKQNLKGEETGMAGQQATGDSCGRVYQKKHKW